MKNYYKIGEISKLYGIGTDSLRYYEELGILKPKRDENGYRLYSLKDIYKLNVIRGLRLLDFSMEQIKDYLDEQSLANTLKLLHQEQALLEQKILELNERKAIIAGRISSLNEAISISPGTISVKTFPERYCVQLNEYITRDEEMDFVIKKLHKKHESRIRDFGNLTIGAFFSMEDWRQGIANVYHTVFFILDGPEAGYDFHLPSGSYLSCCYQGSYQQNGQRIQELLTYARRRDYTLLSQPFEIYQIDNRDTALEEEFLTEIQLRVEPPSAGSPPSVPGPAWNQKRENTL